MSRGCQLRLDIGGSHSKIVLSSKERFAFGRQIERKQKYMRSNSIIIVALVDVIRLAALCGPKSESNRTMHAWLPQVIPNDRPTPHDLSDLKKKKKLTPLSIPLRFGETQKRRHLENTICLNSIHAQTGPLPALDNLAPVPDGARAPPKRRVRPEHGAERRGRLQTLRGVDLLEHFARNGKVVFYGLLVRCTKHQQHAREKESVTSAGG